MTVPAEPTASSHPPPDVGARGPAVIAPPPIIYLGGLGVGFGMQAILPPALLPGAVSWPVGGLLLVAGAALARSFLRAFARAGTPVSPYSAPTRLVTAGAYRLSRNPGYLGMALAYAGIAVITQSLWALIPLVAVLLLIDRGVIAREERCLQRVFGEEYLRYKSRTRRWI